MVKHAVGDRHCGYRTEDDSPTSCWGPYALTSIVGAIGEGNYYHIVYDPLELAEGMSTTSATRIEA